MTARGRSPALAAVALAAGCALPLDEGKAFRQRLAGMRGQPASLLSAERGPNAPEVTPTGRRYVWQMMTIGFARPGGNCVIEIEADEADTIIGARMEGSDYICGSHIVQLRRNAARYRADPELWQRVNEAMRRRLEELVRLRRELSPDE